VEVVVVEVVAVVHEWYCASVLFACGLSFVLSADRVRPYVVPCLIVNIIIIIIVVVIITIIDKGVFFVSCCLILIINLNPWNYFHPFAVTSRSVVRNDEFHPPHRQALRRVGSRRRLGSTSRSRSPRMLLLLMLSLLHMVQTILAVAAMVLIDILWNTVKCNGLLLL
jgi:hypothetical protein